MARDEKRRQKALQKKAAKRKAKKAPRAGTGGGRKPSVPADAPVHECLVPEELFEQGLGNVVVARRLPDGHIAAGVFLVDVYCLGVKGAFLARYTLEEYRHHMDHLAEIHRLRSEDPAAVRKLVEGAVAYARDLGIEPHPDYRDARRVFAGIDADACEREFTYGKDGKPFYVASPRDSALRRKKILQLLERRCGPGGYDYVLPLDTPPFG
ncbi:MULTISPECIES: hypothetical protein [Deferrisoma]